MERTTSKREMVFLRAISPWASGGGGRNAALRKRKKSKKPQSDERAHTWLAAGSVRRWEDAGQPAHVCDPLGRHDGRLALHHSRQPSLESNARIVPCMCVQSPPRLSPAFRSHPTLPPLLDGAAGLKKRWSHTRTYAGTKDQSYT